VKAVETNAETNGIVRCHIYPENGASLVTMVSQAAREQGWDIEELHVERGRLDDVFRLLTTDQAPIAP
jgi:ABC-2 type transport system ATP-binding protein